MRRPPHPGETIRHDCLEPLGLTVEAASEVLGVDAEQLVAVLDGRAGVTGALADRLARAFGGSPVVWVRMQAAWDRAQRRRVSASRPFGKVSDLKLFDPAAYLDGPEARAAYLVAASEGGDPDRISAAVDVVLRVRAARTEAERMVISDEDYAAASVRGAAEQACVPVIAWASYDAGRHELVIESVNGMKLTTPVAILQELHEVPVEALGEIEVEGGENLEFRHLHAQSSNSSASRSARLMSLRWLLLSPPQRSTISTAPRRTK